MIRVNRGRPKNKTQPVPKVSEPQTPDSAKTKTRVLYILIVIILPCAFLFGAEIILRLFHIGYEPRFFRKVNNRDGVYCVDNPAFGRRFFPSTLVRMSEKLRFPLSKDVNDRRIFILGSSAAQGEPAPAFAFSRNLDRLLQGRYGPTHCDVINTAITATNSYVVVPIARECSRLSPDIFIVYLGNNEVIGPFGPGTVFSRFSSRRLVRLRIFLSSTRLGQLASSVSASIANSKGIPAGWGGMKMFLQHKFRSDDPKMTGVYRNYRDNLREICRAARSSGARVVLCTVASNMKDCGPFFSLHRTDLAPDELRQWNGYFQQAVDLQRQGRFAAASVRFSEAAELDSTHADLRFRMAQCLAASSQFNKAEKHFIAARDYDALRFRADSRLNLIVKDVAREFADCAVLFDTEQRLTAASDQKICGKELFLEHVHFNFHGNYLLATEMLTLLDSLIAVPVVAPRIISEAACRERLAFTLWEEFAIDRAIYDRLTKPPFTGQEDNLRRAQAFQREMTRLSAFGADSGQSIIAGYQHAASLESRDWRIYDLLGRYLLLNDTDAVAAEQAFRTVLGFLPHDQFVRNNLAITLERQDRLSEAIRLYREAIRIDPLFFDAYINLADDLVKTSHIDEAIRCLKQVLHINPTLPSARMRYEQVLLSRGKVTSAARGRH